MELRDYQDIAARELFEGAEKLLAHSEPKKLVFKAPTGSGKTVTVAEFLKRLADDAQGHMPLSFIWAAPRQLHDQSKEKLESYYADSHALKCSSFEDLNDRCIEENEILFFNWESIRQENNIYIHENEQDNNLSSILDRTREAGREIVLIIDESHYHAQAETSLGLLKMINPKLTIEVSATPVLNDPDKVIVVDIDDVRKEAVIKKAVSLNPGFKNAIERSRVSSTLSDSTDEIVLREALAKREELAKHYKEAGVEINPLLLVQLPDRRGQTEDEMLRGIERILKDKHNISVANGKLGFYLSEDKRNREHVEEQNNPVEVLIFKQAIALGWDCPRAQVLALFREWKSVNFSIQTVGRIMRMPEPERGAYYSDDVLNYAYVYTNIEDIEIDDDVAGRYVTIHTSVRSKDYKPLKLPSVHRLRQRERTRLAPRFIEIFLEQAKEYDDKKGLAKSIKTKGQKVEPRLITDWKAKNIDALKDTKIEGSEHVTNSSGRDLQRLFDYFARESLSPQYYPEDRSVGRVKESIYRFFRDQVGIDYATHFSDVINIALSEENRGHIRSVLDAAKLAYQAETEKRDTKLVQEDWEVPEFMTFGKDHKELKAGNSIMQPFFYDYAWKPEEHFIEELKRSKDILWWFKNGSRDATYFAVEYKENGKTAPFYVDFIVKMKNGSIGLFDTKSGRTITDSKDKCKGLKSYITAENKSGRKVFGGIVANTDDTHFDGRWMLYEGDGHDLQPGNFEGWSEVEL